jgi:glycosyltransferase involved in cell wall biosynthesis
MHVLFVHKNFPAQFGHIASYLARREGFQCTFVCELPSGTFGGVRRLQYKPAGGATKSTHYCNRMFENCIWHAHAVYEKMKAHPEVHPDLIVGHSGLGSTFFLADLYGRPIVNYFEYYYRATNSDMDFRHDFPSRELDVLRARTRNAMILLDLETCTAGYTPTHWQRSLLPAHYQGKIETIFDGIDTEFWRRRSVPRKIGQRQIPSGTRIVTYVSRGFESMRGFDVFMRVAKRICDVRRDVVFVCVGSDRVCYGGDLRHIKEKSFREHVLAQDDYDLSRFLFTGRVPPDELVRILSLSDLHVYLTVPFVLSWSMMNALACGCTVLASDTPPVREMIEHERNGLLAGFYDVDALVQMALDVLDDPEAFRPLGRAGVEMIEENYSLSTRLPMMLDLYRCAASGATPPGPAG